MMMRVHKIFLDWSDRIDIWIQDKYKKQPKRKLLELQQDLFPNERVTKAISEALHNMKPYDLVRPSDPVEEYKQMKERSPRKEKKKKKKPK
jgi:hypothetical protein